MYLKDLVLFGVLGAAAVIARRAARRRTGPPPPSPAERFRSEMERPEPPQRAAPEDPAYGPVRQSAPYHAPHSTS